MDTLQPDWLKVTIGDATARLSACVNDGLVWISQYDYAENTDDAVDHALTCWYNATFQELQALYVRQEAALVFRVAGTSIIPVNPRRARLAAIHQACARELVRIVRDLHEERATISRALEDLQDRLAKHQELVDRLRTVGSDAQAVWEKVVVDPMLASPITKLMNNGVATNSVYDLVKAGVLGLLF